jgi:uncharacterized protein YhfF
MGIKKTPATNDYWAEFVTANGTNDRDYTVVVFGDGSEPWDELVDLVLSGTKRATASLARDYTSGDEPMPQLGDFVIVIDSKETPRCIWRTTEIVVKPFIDVDDAFAWDEGEGDRTRVSWLFDHREYFTDQAAQEGFEMSDEIETVFERFEIVWPPDVADVSV